MFSDLSTDRRCSAALRIKEEAVDSALRHLSVFGVTEIQINSLIDENVFALISRSSKDN